MTKLLPRSVPYLLQVLENNGANRDGALTNGMCCHPTWLEPYCPTSRNMGCHWHPFSGGRSTFLFGVRGTVKYDAYVLSELCAILWICTGSTFQPKGQEKPVKSAILWWWQVSCKIQTPQTFKKSRGKIYCGNTLSMQLRRTTVDGIISLYWLCFVFPFF